MSKTFSELVETAKQEKLAGIQLPGGKQVSVDEFAKNCVLLSELMRTDGKYAGARIKMDEALRAPDVSILFPKVISDVLLRPKEPMMIGQTLLAKTIQVDNVRSIEFPTLGALRAFDMSDTQEYREQLPAFTEHFTEIKVNKVGLALALSEDIISDSMWDVMALYLEAAGFAMLRHKEQKIFNEWSANGHVVFDNALTAAAAHTHGKSEAQAANGSITFDDMLDAMGALVANEYVPTDFIFHPLAWTIMAKDPVLRSVMFTGGQIGQTIWSNSMPDFDQTHNVPWSVKYNVTPFMPFQRETTLATGPFDAAAATNITDIAVIDRQNSTVILQRDPMEIEKFDDPRRDIQMAKLRERYGVGTMNGGKATVMIKNVLLNQNWAPFQTIYTATPA